MISVHFIGRVGKDAEVIDGQHGQFLSMNVADEVYSKGENKVRWTRVTTSDPALVKRAKYFTKGKPLEIQGELMEDRKWGEYNEFSQHVVKAKSIDFVPGGKKRQDGQGSAENNIPAESVVDSSQPFPPSDGKGDDLPF